MDIESEIAILNDQIDELNSEADFLINSVSEIVAANDALIKEYQSAYYPAEIENHFPNKLAILKEANDIKGKVQILKTIRNGKLEHLINCSYLSLAELEWILEQFGVYYQTITIGRKTIFAPQEFVILQNKVWDVDKLKGEAALRLAPEGEEKSTLGVYVVPEYQREDLFNLYKKVTINVAKSSDMEPQTRYEQLKSKVQAFRKLLMGEEDGETLEKRENSSRKVVMPVLLNKEPLSKQELVDLSESYPGEELFYEKATTLVKPNEYIETLSPSIVAISGELVPFYELSGNGVKPTKKILNVLPYEVFSFLEGYIMAKASGSALNLREYYQENNLALTRK